MPGYEAPQQGTAEGQRATRADAWQHLFGRGKDNRGGVTDSQVIRLIQEIEARLPPDVRGKLIRTVASSEGGTDALAKRLNMPVKALQSLIWLQDYATGDRSVTDMIGVADSDAFVDAYNDAVDYVTMASAEEIANREAAVAEGRRRDVTNQIQQFIDDMTGPSRPDDPIRNGLIAAGVDAAQASAGAAGLSGKSSLAGTQAASIAQQGLLPYEAQRASLRQQGIGTLNQRDLTQQQLDDAWNAMQLARQDRASEASWAGQMNQQQGLGAALGTAAGALGFIGGPALGAATMGAGGAFGAGVASLGAPASPNYQPPKSRGGPRGSGPGF